MGKSLRTGLLRHWPKEGNVRDVVAGQAESSRAAVLLAVHQPMQFVVKDPAGRKVGDATQDELLARLLEDQPDGYRIVPLLGFPGVGKSHAIRWIEAKLFELDSAKKFHIVRVQKGSSLRDVLFQVARGLDAEKYEEFKSRIEEAKEGLGEGTLLWALTGELTAELGHASVPEWVDDDRIDAYEVWSEGLRAFLGDHIVREKFLDNGGLGPLAHLARRIQEGLRPEEVDADSVRHRFLPDDFEEALSLLRPEIANLSKPAKEFLVQLDADGRVECADLLNGALDPATFRLLSFRGGELNRLFVAVRQQLFRDGREWVLLLEDLTALAGIRGDLFNVIVRGKDDQDEEELCTIRSVLAATPGHVSGFKGPWDTLTSRAEQLYEMPQDLANQEYQVGRAANFVAAYINAARCGREGLERAFSGRESADNWVPNYSVEHADKETLDALEAFEKSDQGYHLFPFNHAAVRQRLLDEHVNTDGTFSYNPRSLTRLVRDTLQTQRSQFADGEFPSSLFGTHQLNSATFIVDVQQRLSGNADRERYLRVLSYWGGQPENDGEAARLASVVYEAFGLPALDFGEPAPEPPSQTGGRREEETGKEAESRPGSPPATSSGANPWQKALTRWRQGKANLTQVQAREIRQAVADAVLRGMPAGWPGLPYADAELRRTIRTQHTFLPRAGTGQASERDAAIVVCVEEDLQDQIRGAEIVLDLLTVLQFHQAKDPWHAAAGAGPVDFRRYTAFVRKHQERAARWLQENICPISRGDDFEDVVQAALVSSALTGCWKGDEKNVADRMACIFAEPAEVPLSQGEWGDMVGQAGKWGETARSDLVNSFSARQGTTGKIPLALDASFLASVVEEAAAGKIKRPPKKRGQYWAKREELPKVLKEREIRLAACSDLAGLFLKDLTKKELDELCTRTKTAGMDRGPAGESLAEALRRGIDELPKDLGNAVAPLRDLRSVGTALAKIALMAGVGDDVIYAVEDVGSILIQLLAIAGPAAKQRLRVLEGEDDKASLRGLQEVVDGIEEALKE